MGTIDLATSPEHTVRSYGFSLVFTAACGVFCTLFLCNLFGRIVLLPRPLFLALFLGLLACGVFLGVCAGSLLLGGSLRMNWNVLALSMLVAVFTGSAMSFYLYHRERLERRVAALKDVEIENERLKRIDSEIRLQGLQSKLNPHFLFNTLNSVAALIIEDPAKAEQSLVCLSGLYRKVLSASNKTWIEVGEELDLLRDFLELVRLRFEERLAFSIHCPEPLLRKKIPALLLQPLAENAVKHAEERAQQKVGIRVSVEEDAGALVLRVSDDGPGFDVDRTAPGFGLYSVQERLRLAYGEDFVFSIRSGEGRGTEVAIRVPDREPPGPGVAAAGKVRG
ncbi:MAG: histidine kinase [Candidatus Aminicenantes bacterium]|nr:histidine kinase [Candidatus Aminicenantes bacterium]